MFVLSVFPYFLSDTSHGSLLALHDNGDTLRSLLPSTETSSNSVPPNPSSVVNNSVMVVPMIGTRDESQTKSQIVIVVWKHKDVLISHTG